MDMESIQAAESYRQMSEQHFNGGYFSEAVQLEVRRFQELDDEEQHQRFAEAFNTAYSLAIAIGAHHRFNDETGEIDLSNEGLGIITISLAYLSEEEALANFESDGVPAYKGIHVETSFDPVPRKQEKWIKAPGDDLGLETHGPTTVALDRVPHGWEEHVFANLDGTLPLDDHYNMEQEIPRLLDAKETLEVVSQALWQTPNVLTAAA